LEYGLELLPEDGNSVAHTATGTVTPKWLAETDIIFSNGRTKLGLNNQQILMRAVLQDAIDNVHGNLLFQDSFPKPDAAGASTRAALVNAARSCFPHTAAIYNRLLSDEEYMANMSVIVSIAYPTIALLTFLIATGSDPYYPKGHQGALQRYCCSRVFGP